MGQKKKKEVNKWVMIIEKLLLVLCVIVMSNLPAVNHYKTK